METSYVDSDTKVYNVIKQATAIKKNTFWNWKSKKKEKNMLPHKIDLDQNFHESFNTFYGKDL